MITPLPVLLPIPILLSNERDASTPSVCVLQRPCHGERQRRAESTNHHPLQDVLLRHIASCAAFLTPVLSHT